MALRAVSKSLLLIQLMILAQTVAFAGQGDDERDHASATLENGRAEAAQYVVRVKGDNDSMSLTLHSESLLKWQNTINKSVHGNVFVWTKDGRPEVIASIFQFYSPRVEFCAEFQSLSLNPLVMQKGSKTLWTPQEPGMVLMPFENTEQPSSTKPQRLRQMRQLVEQFNATVTVYSGETYPLRLMPQPLIRYESPASNLVDGALFALTYTTDPDLLIAIEARKTTESARWFYGIARMHTGELRVSYRDREVWTADRLNPPYFYRDGIYTLFKELPLPEKRN